MEKQMSLPTLQLLPVNRPYSQGELIADGAIHVVAIIVGLIAFGALFSRIIDHGATLDGLAVGVYAVGFFLMFGFSCAYNLTPHSSLKVLLGRFDRAAIFIMIAGTYTGMLAPFANRFWADALLIIVWIGALLGGSMKLFLPGRGERVSLALYLLLGWVVIVAIQPLIASLPAATLALVVIGGLLYSTGTIFYKWHSLKYQNAIWHCFVAAAAACHFAGVVYVISRTA